MGNFWNAVAGIGTLIALYLFLKNPSAATSIISALASNATSGIKTLQGR